MPSVLLVKQMKGRFHAVMYAGEKTTETFVNFF